MLVTGIQRKSSLPAHKRVVVQRLMITMMTIMTVLVDRMMNWMGAIAEHQRSRDTLRQRIIKGK